MVTEEVVTLTATIETNFRQGDLETKVRTCQATDRDLERVSAVKKMNAWICALLTTDRDVASVNAMTRVNAWMSALLTTDRDLASVVPDKKRKSVTTVIFCETNVIVEFVGPVTFSVFLLFTK